MPTLNLENITKLIRERLEETVKTGAKYEYIYVEAVEIEKKLNKQSSGNVIYCHETEGQSAYYKIGWTYDGETTVEIEGDPEKVVRQVVYKPVEPTKHTQIRMVESKAEDEFRVGGYGVVFGDENQKDLEGTFFTKSTDYWLKYYSGQPVLFDHAIGLALPKGVKQDTAPDFIIGQVDPASVKVDEIGIWMETVLSAHEEWSDIAEGQKFNQAVVKMVDDGVLHYSTGSPIHLIDTKENGEMLSWPIVELSITPTPAEPRQTQLQRVTRRAVINPSADQQTRLEPHPIVVMFKGIGYDQQAEEPASTESSDEPTVDLEATIKALAQSRSLELTIKNLIKTRK